MATLLEEARARLFYSDSVGSALLDDGIVVAEQTIEYKKPVFYSLDPVQVDITVVRIGTSSFDFNYAVSHRGDKDLAKGKTTLVTVDKQTGRPKRLSEEQISWLQHRH
jgi:acyl-CoA thioester hydrolase